MPPYPRRELLRAVGSEASAAKAALQAAVIDKGQLSIANSGLSDGLERQSVRNEELRLSASALEAQLAAATAEVALQRSQLQTVGTESMNMRQVSPQDLECGESESAGGRINYENV